MTGLFYLRYAVRSLRRSGQRSLLAIVCIAFGVLSLISMQLLAGIIADGLMVDPRAQLGGDVELTLDGQPFTVKHLATLDQFQDEQIIQAYTVRAVGRTNLMRTEQTGRVNFVSRVYGIDPATFPLVGEITFRNPENGSLAELLTPPGSAVISDELADRMDLVVGSRFTLAGQPGQLPISLTISGIADHLPDRNSDAILYSLDTARQIAGREDVISAAHVLWGTAGDTGAQFEQGGWSVRRPNDEPPSDAIELFSFMLGGAGILGLLVGGIGVANTMHVILARRTPEIATLKTLGYQQRDLLKLFGIETALLGLIGAIPGVLGAMVLAHYFMQLLDQNMPIMLEYTIDWGVVTGGLLTGVLTAIIFGLAAIVRASGVRPGVLLRNLPIKRTFKTHMATVALYGVLLILFSTLSSVLLGSALKGVGVVAAGLVGLVVLGLVLGFLLFLLVRIPMPGLPLLGMARRNLRHHPLRAVVALVALFVGVFSIGFATASLLNAQQRADSRSLAREGYNLLVNATLADDDAVHARLKDEAVTAFHAGYQVPVQIEATPETALSRLSTMEGRLAADSTWNLSMIEGAWNPAPDAALIPASFQDQIELDDTIQVSGAGSTQSLRITGFYRPNSQGMLSRPPQGILVNRATALAIGGEEVSINFIVEVVPDHLPNMADQLGQAIPTTMVITMDDIDEVINRFFRSLFLFVIAVASLALVAGAVLIANAVGLSMVERKRELGILKAIGYTSARVMRTVLFENALLGILSGLAGVTGVALAIQVINWRFEQAQMSLDPLQALFLMAFAVLLAVGSAAFVAWRPTHIRPQEVLRTE